MKRNSKGLQISISDFFARKKAVNVIPSGSASNPNESENANTEGNTAIGNNWHYTRN